MSTFTRFLHLLCHITIKPVYPDCIAEIIEKFRSTGDGVDTLRIKNQDSQILLFYKGWPNFSRQNFSTHANCTTFYKFQHKQTGPRCILSWKLCSINLSKLLRPFTDLSGLVRGNSPIKGPVRKTGESNIKYSNSGKSYWKSFDIAGTNELPDVEWQWQCLERPENGCHGQVEGNPEIPLLYQNRWIYFLPQTGLVNLWRSKRSQPLIIVT